MSIYEHKQGKYTSYRVARSVNGVLRQKYFPMTRAGLTEARNLDDQWASEQADAQTRFTGARSRWRREPIPAGPHNTRYANKRVANSSSG